MHPYFNIYTDSQGGFVLVDTIIGVNEPYSDSMVFEITDHYSYTNYFLHAEEGSFTLFNADVSDTSGVVIANQHLNYRTIGSNIRFGKLIDIDTVNTKKDYLLSILEFFGVKKYIYVNTPQIEHTSEKSINIKIYPNPAKDNLTINLFNSMHKSSMYQILNIHGKLIKEQIVTESIWKESIALTWNCKDNSGRSLPKGIYLIRYVSGKQSITKKIILH